MAIPILIIVFLMYRIIKEHPRHQVQQEDNLAPFKLSTLFKKRNLILAYIIIFCSIYGFL
ncbi:hypothetical protein O0G44_03125 [Staphylococcus delphini]|nr:hypothetical protein [Staphylococcus delphini]MDE9752207.1 hypothetical protein [Staphylococcus delphini]